MKGSIMFQGTASDAGKSVLAAGFCRILKEDGYSVVPFKSQNMALNSYITATGDEMGRAQVFQAEAAGVPPDVRMNPVLLKPSTDRQSQVILLGKVLRDMDAVEYHDYKLTLLPKIQEVYQELAAENDVIVIEGAGSPAEINLNDRDIVNMGMANLVNAPVILVADIDKGGVFASIYGTLELMPPEDKARVVGVIINKFRGDKALLQSGLEMIEELTKVPVIGVMPYLTLDIDDEDSVVLSTKQKQYDPKKELDIAVIVLSRLSNFTDMGSLERQPDVSLRYVRQASEFKHPDLLIIPGTKNTLEEVRHLEKTGLAEAIKEYAKGGGRLIGICGGYQLLGRKLIEEGQDEAYGLGILPIETQFATEKITTQVKAETKGHKLKGYEIHTGRTEFLEELSYFSTIVEENGDEIVRNDGAVSADGRIIGTYLHGLFDNISWSRTLLNQLRKEKGLDEIKGNTESLDAHKNREYGKLAQGMRDNIDIPFIYKAIERFGVE